MASLIDLLFKPHDIQSLTQFYFSWVLIYMMVHLVWDALSSITPKFSLRVLPLKINELYSSTTFATSVFYVVILFDLTNPLRTSDVFIFPLIISALSGFMVSLSVLPPVKRDP